MCPLCVCVRYVCVCVCVQEHVRDLQRAAAEAKRLEAERIRAERGARRDTFKSVVVGLVDSGDINALSQWASLKERLEATPEGITVAQDGVTLQTVFYDVVDALMAKYKGDKKVRSCSVG